VRDIEQVAQHEQPPAPAVSLLPGRKLTEPDGTFIRDLATAIRAGARPLTAAQWLGVSKKTWRAWRQRRGSPYDEMRDSVRAALAHLETKLQAELAKRSPGAALKGLRRVRDEEPDDTPREYHKAGLHSLKRALPRLLDHIGDADVPTSDLTDVEHAARQFQRDVIADLGGHAHLTTAKLALLRAVTGSWLLLSSVDAYLMELSSTRGLVNRKTRSAFAIVEQRARIADSFARQLQLIGLDRVTAPPMDLNTYITTKYGTQNGDVAETPEKEPA